MFQINGDGEYTDKCIDEGFGLEEEEDEPTRLSDEPGTK